MGIIPLTPQRIGVTPERIRALSLNVPGRLRAALASDAPCYNACMLPELKLDDVVRMRKPHPCGSYEWKIVRLGADIGLECLTCGRRVLLPRRKLAQRMKGIIGQSKNESD